MSKLVRYLLVGLLCIGAIGCFVYSWNTGTGKSDPFQAVTEKFLKDNPELAGGIKQLKKVHDENALAVAIKSGGKGALPSEASIRLAALALKEEGTSDRETLLWSHGSLVDVFSQSPQVNNDQSQQVINDHLGKLEKARDDDDLWAVVRDDPVALGSAKIVADGPGYRTYYSDNRDWIQVLLADLMDSRGVSPAPDAPDNLEVYERPELDKVLEVAKANHPHLKEAVKNVAGTPGLPSVVFLLFDEFGEILRPICEADVPANEVIDVALLNADFLGRKLEEKDTLAAANLVRIYRQKPGVWESARIEPFALRFDELAPKHAQSLIDKHPQLGIPSFVITQYETETPQAAAAIDKYGELGVATLLHFSESKQFHRLLSRPDVDTRLIMVAVIEGDAGLQRVEDNPAYIDRVIADDGNPRDPDWWQSLPLVGGVANVARNMATGRPNTWGDIGWAAWDVADGVLMVASFGTSKIVTEGGELVGKSTARNFATKAVKLKGSESLVTRGVKSPTALDRLASFASKAPMGKAAVKLVVGGKRVVVVTGEVGAKSLRGAARALNTVNDIPMPVRRWAARGLLAASLLARTPERFDAAATAIGTWTGKLAKSIANALPTAMNAALDQLLGSGNSSRISKAVVIAFAGFMSGLLAWQVAWPSRKSLRTV